MNLDAYFELGYIAKAHGVAGEVKAVFDVSDISRYKKKESVLLLRQGKLAPFSIESFHILSGSEALLSFAGVDDRDAAEDLQGCGIFLPLTELPQAPKGKFYFHEVPGFAVEDKVLGRLGTVREMIEMPAQNLIVMDYQGAEVLIPVTDHIVTGIDRENQVIFTHLPPGHLEVYQNPGSEEAES